MLWGHFKKPPVKFSPNCGSVPFSSTAWPGISVSSIIISQKGNLLSRCTKRKISLPKEVDVHFTVCAHKPHRLRARACACACVPVAHKRAHCTAFLCEEGNKQLRNYNWSANIPWCVKLLLLWKVYYIVKFVYRLCRHMPVHEATLCQILMLTLGRFYATHNSEN